MTRSGLRRSSIDMRRTRGEIQSTPNCQHPIPNPITFGSWQLEVGRWMRFNRLLSEARPVIVTVRPQDRFIPLEENQVVDALFRDRGDGVIRASHVIDDIGMRLARERVEICSRKRHRWRVPADFLEAETLFQGQ